MTRTLKLADDLSLPLDAATQTFAFIARKGAGKTYAAGKLAELLLDAGVQVVVLDTVGNWYGLRLAADGKSQGFDVPVLGGLRGDIPLEAAGGGLIADIVIDTGRSLVLDASQFSLADRKRFATSFAERLWQRKKGERHPSPLHIVIEESQLIVPQFTKGAETMVGIYEEIIRLGRNYGIGVSMVTQRPQSVNKEVLNQTECLLVGQVNGYQERDALKKWITHQGMDVHLVDELPSLKVGTFYVWSPQWLNVLRRVAIERKRTFDASATPKVGDKRVARELKPLDLADLRERMVATIERAKADDPKELRKLLAERDRRIRELESQKSAPKVERVEVPVLDQGTAAGFDAVVANLRSVSQDIERQLVEARAIAGRAATPPMGGLRQVGSRAGSAPARGGTNHGSRRAEPARANGHDALVLGRGGDRRMLIALAQFPGGVTASKLSLLTGIARKGGTFRTYLAKLKQAGYVEGGNDRLLATPSGVAALGDFDPLPTGQELIAYWRRELGDSGMRAMFDVLVAVHPGSLTKSELAERTNIAEGGGTFRTYLGKLKQLELVEGRGELRAAEELFA